MHYCMSRHTSWKVTSAHKWWLYLIWTHLGAIILKVIYLKYTTVHRSVMWTNGKFPQSLTGSKDSPDLKSYEIGLDKASTISCIVGVPTLHSSANLLMPAKWYHGCTAGKQYWICFLNQSDTKDVQQENNTELKMKKNQSKWYQVYSPTRKQ